MAEINNIVEDSYLKDRVKEYDSQMVNPIRDKVQNLNTEGALTNPLVINGTAYDGHESVTMSISGGGGANITLATSSINWTETAPESKVWYATSLEGISVSGTYKEKYVGSTYSGSHTTYKSDLVIPATITQQIYTTLSSTSLSDDKTILVTSYTYGNYQNSYGIDAGYISKDYYTFSYYGSSTTYSTYYTYVIGVGDDVVTSTCDAYNNSTFTSAYTKVITSQISSITANTGIITDNFAISSDIYFYKDKYELIGVTSASVSTKELDGFNDVVDAKYMEKQVKNYVEPISEKVDKITVPRKKTVSLNTAGKYILLGKIKTASAATNIGVISGHITGYRDIGWSRGLDIRYSLFSPYNPTALSVGLHGYAGKDSNSTTAYIKPRFVTCYFNNIKYVALEVGGDGVGWGGYTLNVTEEFDGSDPYIDGLECIPKTSSELSSITYLDSSSYVPVAIGSPAFP